MPSILVLIKPWLSIAVAFSALAEYLVCRPALGIDSACLFTGVFLLSSSASALNQAIEAGTDRLMSRTRLRPVASGRLTPALAVFIGVLLAIPGSLLLIRNGLSVSILGVGNLLLYTFVYTPLKQRTGWALPLGAVVGIIPVWMGGFAAHVSLKDPRLVYPSVFMFLWQLAHFSFISWRYRHEYRSAGFPPPLGIRNWDTTRTLALAWLSLTVVSTTLFIVTDLVSRPLLIALLMASGVAVWIAVMVMSLKGAWLRTATTFLVVYQIACWGTLIVSAYLKF